MKRNRKLSGRRILSLVFALALILGMMPMQAARAEDTVSVQLTVYTAESVVDGEVKGTTVTAAVPSDTNAFEYFQRLAGELEGIDFKAEWNGIETWDTEHIWGYGFEVDEIRDPGDWRDRNCTMGELSDAEREWTFVPFYDDKAVVVVFASYCNDGLAENWEDGNQEEEVHRLLLTKEEAFFDKPYEYFWYDKTDEMRREMTEALDGIEIPTEIPHDPNLGNASWYADDWSGYFYGDEDDYQMALNFLWTHATYEKAGVVLHWWSEDRTDEENQTPTVISVPRGTQVNLAEHTDGESRVWEYRTWDETIEKDVLRDIYTDTYTVPEDGDNYYHLNGVNMQEGYTQDQIKDALQSYADASPGETVSMPMPEDNAIALKEIFFTVVEGKQNEYSEYKQVNIEFAKDFYTWTVDSDDVTQVTEPVPEGFDGWDVDLEVTKVESDDTENAIPAELKENVLTGIDNAQTQQISVTHEGEFFYGDIRIAKMTLTVKLGTENAGRVGTVYYYNKAENKLEPIASDVEIDSQGNIKMTLTHASDYLIVTEPVVSKITYVLDGGTNAADNPASYKEGDVITLKEATKAGYTFGGWYSDAAYTKKVTVIDKNMTGDITLYAKWDLANSQGTQTPPPTGQTPPPTGPTITVPANPQYDGWAGVSAEQKAKLMQESLAKSQGAKVTAPKTDDSNAMAVGLFLAAAAAFCSAVVFGKKKLLMK